MKPTKLTKNQLIDILKVALYLGISTALGALIDYLNGNQNMLGIYTPIVNVLLVTIRNVFKAEDEHGL